MSRATEIGEGIGLDVEGSRARYAADRLRYRRALSAALDRLCVEYDDVEYDDGNGWLVREPVPYAAAGMTYPFERREVYGRGEETSEAPTSGAERTTGDVDRSVHHAGAAGPGQRAVPVPVRVPEAARRMATNV